MFAFASFLRPASALWGGPACRVARASLLGSALPQGLGPSLGEGLGLWHGMQSAKAHSPKLHNRCSKSASTGHTNHAPPPSACLQPTNHPSFATGCRFFLWLAYRRQSVLPQALVPFHFLSSMWTFTPLWGLGSICWYLRLAPMGPCRAAQTNC